MSIFLQFFLIISQYRCGLYKTADKTVEIADMDMVSTVVK